MSDWLDGLTRAELVQLVEQMRVANDALTRAVFLFEQARVMLERMLREAS